MAKNNRVKSTNDLELKDRLVAINRVTKVTKGGRAFSFAAIVVVGNEDGVVGWGLGKANEVTAAIAKGVVYQERFWAPELLDSDDPAQAYKVMNINVLTKNDPPYNPEYGTYTLRGFQVKVSPSDDEILKSVWIEPEQFQPWMPAPSDKTEDVFDYGA